MSLQDLSLHFCKPVGLRHCLQTADAVVFLVGPPINSPSPCLLHSGCREALRIHKDVSWLNCSEINACMLLTNAGSEGQGCWVRRSEASCCFPTEISCLAAAGSSEVRRVSSEIKSEWVGGSLEDSLSLGKNLAQIKFLFTFLMQRYSRSN